MPNRDPDVLAALHRFYIDSLPPHHRRRVEERASERVRAMDLPEALGIVAGTPEVDRLTKWHLTATALHRNPTDFTRPGILGRLVDVIGTKPEPRGRERASSAMSAFAHGGGPDDPTPDDDKAPGAETPETPETPAAPSPADAEPDGSGESGAAGGPAAS